LEQHEGLLAGLHEAATQLPQLESRLTARLEQHEGLLAGLHEAATQLPQLESRLTARLEQHEGSLAGLHEAAAQLPQLESRLTARLEQHEGSLTNLHQQFPQLDSRLEQNNLALESLQHISAEQKSGLEIASQTLTAVRERMVSLESQLGDARERAERAAEEASEEAKRQAATLQVSLSGEIHALEMTVKSNAAAIDSIRAAMARADDFMERMVEALESLQTMVLDQARDRAVA
jgi:chromosome segregation ATPase